MKKRSGFSLLEVLVAMTLSGMLLVIISTLMVTLLRFGTKSQQQETFEQVMNDLHFEFSNNVRWGKSVIVTPTELMVDGKNYAYRDFQIVKNEEPLTPASVKITSFEVKDLSQDPNYKSVQITVNMQSAHDASIQDSLRTVISQRRMVI